ncbi:LysM peptidoglycan-binding domain-containing protein [Microaerobacter geothermalis]|uniref:LysM peptidoglycan-binding domain-containing protein n=1 Tax=Microaerobacter geothermalis TaxID=674972 RepID=UPI001F1D732E|nr:LysM peptidoglycan-binding domain-containing protein [Microaerobacter geothermalis]MCF6094998.1 LysM peptidoglycan-binding domain-containing protein [Microaerobacter geothermalis]
MKKKWIIPVLVSSVMVGGLTYPSQTNAATYTVHAGDSLYLIGKKYGLTSEQLRTANQLTNDWIYPGQVLTIPEEGPTKTTYLTYEVKNGDFLWKIAKQYKLTVNILKQWNNLASDVIYPGQTLSLPFHSHQVVTGDTLWLLSKKYGTNVSSITYVNNLSSDVLYPGQKLLIPAVQIIQELETQSSQETPTLDHQSNSVLPSRDKPHVTYEKYTVQQGDTAWTISIQFGIPMQEVLDANNLTEDSIMMPGMVLNIPVHHVPVKETAGPQYGELLDWWTEAQYVWPIGKDAWVKDFATGKIWRMKRTTGAFHADVEPLTLEDSKVMKEVWGGNWSWERRAVLIRIDGRTIAASASAMPHDVQQIKDNGFPGHSDIHFLNSTRHKDNQMDEKHQAQVAIAAGVSR